MADLSDFHYQIAGNDQGHKLVFLHGILGSGANWRGIVPSFKDRFHILTFDQRGHGKSFQPQSGYSPKDYAQDLRLILDSLKWEKIHLVGHSMGGRNALEFANLYSERLHSLVIEDIGVEAGVEPVKRIENLLNLVPRPFKSREAARDFFNNDYPQLIGSNPSAKTLSQYFYTNIIETSGGGADWRFSLNGVLESLREGRREDRWDLIEGLEVPTLYLRGERSQDLSRENFEIILKKNPIIKGLEIQDSGHWIHFDQPESFVRAVNDFLTLQL